MDIFPDKETSEQLLNSDSLLGEICFILPVIIHHFHHLEFFAGVEDSPGCLNPNAGSLFLQKFLALSVHSEFRLNFERCLAISLPVFLGLIGRVIIQFCQRFF